mmetsp:Transcript_18302/g.26280  ORF Transcript_18302/g.26280 Transcript_18302/m.26280 type:complete len:201 (-) Transcript_18302:137-739(-)
MNRSAGISLEINYLSNSLFLVTPSLSINSKKSISKYVLQRMLFYQWNHFTIDNLGHLNNTWICKRPLINLDIPNVPPHQIVGQSEVDLPLVSITVKVKNRYSVVVGISQEPALDALKKRESVSRSKCMSKDNNTSEYVFMLVYILGKPLNVCFQFIVPFFQGNALFWFCIQQMNTNIHNTVKLKSKQLRTLNISSNIQIV